MARPRSRGDHNFVAYSDIMTCLAIIFLFIAVAYILEGLSNKMARDIMYNSIDDQLKVELAKKNVKLDNDMSLKFLQDSSNIHDQLFEIGSAEMTPTFKNKVAAIWPEYQKVLVKPEHLKFIGEIRIEGHTDTIAPAKNKQESYLYNLNLSSARAQNVLAFVRNLESYKNLDIKNKKKLDFLLTANGMSFSRPLNKHGNLTYKDENDRSIDLNKSRRVEFRINTTNEELEKNLETK